MPVASDPNVRVASIAAKSPPPQGPPLQGPPQPPLSNAPPVRMNMPPPRPPPPARSVDQLLDEARAKAPGGAPNVAPILEDPSDPKTGPKPPTSTKTVSHGHMVFPWPMAFHGLWAVISTAKCAFSRVYVFTIHISTAKCAFSRFRCLHATFPRPNVRFHGFLRFTWDFRHN